jgi:hypothetical protein
VTTGTQLFQTQAGNSAPVSYDVSAFVEGLSAGAYAGFSLWAIEPFELPHILRGVFDNNSDAFFPQLTITYALQGSPVPVPEPATWLMLLIGLLGLGLLAGRRRKAA